MRIIAGTHRGMNLFAPKDMRTRPITDRAKESLFNVLYKYNLIEDGVVADLFSGTGSMGMECLSRGARWVSFVDSGRQVIPLLERNIAKAGYGDRCRVVGANAFKSGAPVPSGCPDRPTYDLVFVDPPYELSRDSSIVSPLGKLLVLVSSQLRQGGIAIVRAHANTNILPQYGGLRSIDHRQWGTTAVSLLECRPEPHQEPSA
jgi:16S rRNA (guanine966-N2)-methyltransferase